MRHNQLGKILFYAAIGFSLVNCGQSSAPTAADQASVGSTHRPAYSENAIAAFQPLTPPKAVDLNKTRIGKVLFSDPRLSRDGSVSCASCHDLYNGGDDGRVTAIGIGGAVGPINTPTVLNSALNFSQFWDGRAESLADQVAGPIHNVVEMGSSWDAVVAELREDEDLVALFGRVYAERITAENIADSIAAYESMLITTGSPFDRYLEGDDNAISEKAKRGLYTFINLGCVSCHQGRNIGGNMYQEFGVMGNYFEDRGNVTEADYGRFNVTGRESDRFLFKVPSLRNVAETGPYFHDGSAETLEVAVSTMVRYQLGRNIPEQDISDIVKFLETLSGSVDESLL